LRSRLRCRAAWPLAPLTKIATAAPDCPMRGTRDLLTDALDIVARIEDPKRRIDVVEVDDQLPECRTSVRDLAADLCSFLDEPGQCVRPISRHAAALLCQ
jgi:hypothetical protein